jgi:hypothetical protein
MDLDLGFKVFNTGVVFFWALLVLAPRARITAALVHAPVVPVIYGVAYIILLFGDGGAQGGDMMSLSGVTTLLSQPRIAFAGWVHYLIFDLFIGAWEARDAQRRGLPHLALVPCLVATLLFGPVGLLCYLGLRFALKRTVGFAETA